MKRLAIITCLILAVVAGAFAVDSAFQTKMDEASIAARQMASVLEVRAPMQSARADLIRHKAAIDAAMAKDVFDTVDPKIKTKLLAASAIINTAVAGLEGCKELLDWEPPKVEVE